MEQKPQISQLGDGKIEASIPDICVNNQGFVSNVAQGIGQFSAMTKPGTDIPSVSIPPVVKIKTEEENAVESLKDVTFAEAEKTKEGLPDVPKIMLESSTGEEPTELIGTSEGGRMEVPRPETLFSAGSQASLMPFNSRVNYAQFSPTLNPLNPQTINNSLSNALQTATTKSSDKFESEGEKHPIDAVADSNNGESSEDSRSKLRLDDLSSVSGDAASIGTTLRRLGIGSDVRSEDVVPSSPDDQTFAADILPGSLGSHLFPKEAKVGPAATPISGFASESPGFQPSNFSVSLFNQLRQEHATRLFTSVDSVAGDLAKPSDIQRAINQVDVKRHFSPMLLNYLNTRPRGTLFTHGVYITPALITRNFLQHIAAPNLFNTDARGRISLGLARQMRFQLPFRRI